MFWEEFGTVVGSQPHPLPHAACLQTQLIQMVVWMLQRRLLIQLHTYVCLMASPSEEEPRPREDDVPFTTRVGSRSLSTPNALSFGSPSRILFLAFLWQFGGKTRGGSQKA